MKTVRLKSMRLENYKSFSELLSGRKNLECEFGHRTKISGKNREGKSSIKDGYFDLLTGKLADGSQPDKVRPHDENGVDIDRVDIIRELALEIDGKPVTVTKKTAQKWRKPRGQSEEVFDGNVTTYAVDGFDIKQKQFTEWQESIADPDVLLMCSNARPFLNTVQKSTSEARKILERMSGFKIEDFIAQNPEYAQIEEITKWHSVEDALKQLRKNLNAQKKSADKARTELSYEKGREVPGSEDIPELQKSVAEYDKKIAELDEKEKALNDVSSAYDEKSREIVELRNKQSQIRMERNSVLLGNRQSIQSEIAELQSQKKEKSNELLLAEMDLRHSNMGIERHTAEVKKAQEDYSRWISQEFDDSEIAVIESEVLNEDSLICPTCGQAFPKERAEKIREDFEKNKALRIEGVKSAGRNYEEMKDREIQRVTESGNKAATDLKEAKKAQEEAEHKIAEIKKSISDLALKIAEKEKELSALLAEADLSSDTEYNAMSAQIEVAQKSLETMDNGSSARAEITEKRNAYIRESAKLAAEINKIQSDKADHERRVEELEEKLKAEGQKCADIEKNIDTLLNFSIEKNKALADMVNPYFKHFQFVFYDFTQEGGIYETLKIMCDGTDFFSGLNRSDQILCEIDLVCGLQKLNNLNLPVWVDNSEAVNADRLPEIEQQMIVLEVSDGDLKVECIDEYMANLDRSYEQLSKNQTISFSLDELRDMESDDWKPTQKIKDFMERMKDE